MHIQNEITPRATVNEHKTSVTATQKIDIFRVQITVPSRKPQVGCCRNYSSLFQHIQSATNYEECRKDVKKGIHDKHAQDAPSSNPNASNKLEQIPATKERQNCPMLLQ